ncbi:hypothetical protein QWZ13_17370 [Reinekea marina]|nr:hypothetical protein [Reinekea marina]MDN3647372.1 hypothetical protein [Reinekea marina]MDN3648754.1 hypothetical protein [Reinekea marina]MDN3649769.1 hypothetical protein [Reinekea marina]MDN3650679.1 hypothetical protein [Reinekea marina]
MVRYTTLKSKEKKNQQGKLEVINQINLEVAQTLKTQKIRSTY